MDARIVLLWTNINRTGVDFSVGGETFQISHLGKGYWKRIFRQGDHPVRTEVSQKVIQVALNSATEFITYQGSEPSKHTPQEFEQMVTTVLNF